MALARRTIRTMCPMNCHPTLCGMLVEVEDERLIGVRGDPENPDSQGFLCVRGQASREIIGNPKRLLFPLVRDRRTDDAWRRAGWEEALDLVVARMQSAGREAVGFWQSHGHFANNYGTRIGLNRLTSGVPAIPDDAVDTFDFSAGQAAFDAMVEVEREKPTAYVRPGAETADAPGSAGTPACGGNERP